MYVDVTIGSWMLAFNVTHYDDRRLCEPECSETSIVVYDIPKCVAVVILFFLFETKQCKSI